MNEIKFRNGSTITFMKSEMEKITGINKPLTATEVQQSIDRAFRHLDTLRDLYLIQVLIHLMERYDIKELPPMKFTGENTEETLGISLKDMKYYTDILSSEVCGMCDEEKKRGHVYCYECFSKLPPEMKRGLYRKLWDGFIEAYEEADEYLRGL